MAMNAPPSVSDLTIDGVVFPATTKPPGSSKTLFLASAGVRGLNIGETFVKFTAIGIYVEEVAVQALSTKWASKSTDDLLSADEFFMDIVTGRFERFSRITMIKPLTGEQYASKVAENCTEIWKSARIYTDSEAAAIEKFKSVFHHEAFEPGASICFTHSIFWIINGKSTPQKNIGFSKDSSVPESGAAVIDNRALTGSILASIIGKHGVSPEAKRSIAERFSGLLSEVHRKGDRSNVMVQNIVGMAPSATENNPLVLN